MSLRELEICKHCGQARHSHTWSVAGDICDDGINSIDDPVKHRRKYERIRKIGNVFRDKRDGSSWQYMSYSWIINRRGNRVGVRYGIYCKVRAALGGVAFRRESYHKMRKHYEQI